MVAQNRLKIRFKKKERNIDCDQIWDELNNHRN